MITKIKEERIEMIKKKEDEVKSREKKKVEISIALRELFSKLSIDKVLK